MKVQEFSHSKLVDIARKFLVRHHPIVLTEMASSCMECPDAIGWREGVSTLIECKASVNDFYSDKKKSFRTKPEYGIGDYRYFLVPKGLLSDRKLPALWGLLETDGRRVFKVVAAVYHPITNKKGELEIMASALRRIGQRAPSGVSVRAYYLTTGDRASMTLDIEQEQPKREGESNE